MPNFTVIPNTFLPLQPSSFSFRKKYHLEHSLLFSCPASDQRQKKPEGIHTAMLKKAISKASNLSFSFLNTIPMPSKWKRKRMEIRHSGFFYETAAPRGTSRHHRKQRRIFIFHPGTTASHVVGGHVQCGVPVDCSWDVGGISTLQGGIVLRNAIPEICSKPCFK